tara:strand:+ start:1364 stop:1795 length:432 start_codon:yes stop_codon:yes gene_type:complete
MGLNHNVWLPHLKFTLQTMAITYPKHPNDVSIKKYYDFIQNLPVFIPMSPIGNNFLELLDKYPVTPYLSSRMSFMKWIHFIFNKINIQLKKKETNFYEDLENYYEEYKPKEMKNKEFLKTRKKYIEGGIIIVLVLGVLYFYRK